jgi:hypothetical protein
VGALVVPDRDADALFRAFEELTAPWRRGGQEVKGRALSETQIAGVIELVGRYDALFDVRGIDMGLHDAARIATFQDGQAMAVTAQITADHGSDWQRWGAETEARMRGLSPQLFLQCMVTIYLVLDLLQAATIYYAQRAPEELGAFHWFVDPKASNRTELERLWTDVMMPMAQTQSTVEPFGTLERCDYSHFSRYYVAPEALPSELAEHMRDKPHDGGIQLKEIMTDLMFPDSARTTGLQIVDILLSAFCRGLNETLGERGWSMLGRLMTTTKHDRSRLVFLRMHPEEAMPGGRRWYDRTLAAIEALRRDILTPDRRKS